MARTDDRARALRLPWVALSCLMLVSAGDLPAQTDSVVVRAGSHYAAGRMKEALLGSEYRDLWTVPIQVPILDPETFAGGLTLLQEGEGRQTRSLRFGTDEAWIVLAYRSSSL